METRCPIRLTWEDLLVGAVWLALPWMATVGFTVLGLANLAVIRPPRALMPQSPIRRTLMSLSRRSISAPRRFARRAFLQCRRASRSEEHTSELQSH